jgi:hypothetical protein
MWSRVSAAIDGEIWTQARYAAGNANGGHLATPATPNNPNYNSTSEASDATGALVSLETRTRHIERRNPNYTVLTHQRAWRSNIFLWTIVKGRRPVQPRDDQVVALA